MGMGLKEFLDSIDTLAAMVVIWAYRDAMGWDEIQAKLLGEKELNPGQADAVVHQARWLLERMKDVA